jgi:hypothetical protein
MAASYRKESLLYEWQYRLLKGGFQTCTIRTREYPEEQAFLI